MLIIFSRHTPTSGSTNKKHGVTWYALGACPYSPARYYLLSSGLQTQNPSHHLHKPAPRTCGKMRAVDGYGTPLFVGCWVFSCYRIPCGVRRAPTHFRMRYDALCFGSDFRRLGEAVARQAVVCASVDRRSPGTWSPQQTATRWSTTSTQQQGDGQHLCGSWVVGLEYSYFHRPPTFAKQSYTDVTSAGSQCSCCI